MLRKSGLSVIMMLNTVLLKNVIINNISSASRHSQPSFQLPFDLFFFFFLLLENMARSDVILVPSVFLLKE